MRYSKKFSILILVIIVCAFLFVRIFRQKVSKIYEGVVDYVFDGDSFKLQNGQQVRLLNIDAPEREEFFSEKSRSFFEKLIQNKKVYLKYGNVEKDKYNRLLAYIFLSPDTSSVEESVNYKMLREGYAIVFIEKDNDDYAEKFIEAQRNAILENKNLWSDNENGPLKEEAGCEYVSSERGYKFHRVGCEFGEAIVQKIILKSKREAFLQGKSPCRRCFKQ